MRWIKTKDRLPTKDCSVLICYFHKYVNRKRIEKKVSVANYDSTRKEFEDYSQSGTGIDTPDYWMMFPKAKEGK